MKAAAALAMLDFSRSDRPMSNPETEQLVAGIFQTLRSASKHPRGADDAQKIGATVLRRVRREREEERFWSAVDRVHELAVRAMEEGE